MVLWFVNHSHDSDVSRTPDMVTRAPNITGRLWVFVSFLYFPQVSCGFIQILFVLFSLRFTEPFGFGKISEKVVKYLIGFTVFFF